MASVVIPRPGSQLGPCEGSCEHRDCEQARADAALVCNGCGQPLGYQRHVYSDPQDPWHESCYALVPWLPPRGQ